MHILTLLSPTRRHLLTLSVAVATIAAPGITVAQSPFPDRPITLVVPFGPSGDTDILARALSSDLQEVLGQPVVIVNRAGATGIIGTEAVARSKPDGYTLVLGTGSTHALNVSAFKTLPYHPLKDFEPVALVGTTPVILYAHPSMPGNAPDFIAKLQANPKKFFYGAAGVSITSLGMELFLNKAHASASPVPYKGTGEAMQAVVGGQVQFTLGALGAGRELVKGKRLAAVAVMSNKRLQMAPEIPTLREAAGLPLELGTWYVVMAPAGTPKEVVNRMNAALNKVLNKPAIQDRLAGHGISPVADSTPASTASFVEREIAKWHSAFKLAGAEAQ